MTGTSVMTVPLAAVTTNGAAVVTNVVGRAIVPDTLDRTATDGVCNAVARETDDWDEVVRTADADTVG